MNNKNKMENQRAHAKKRLLDRAGIVLHDAKRREWVLDIQKGKWQAIAKRSNRVRVFLAEYEGQCLGLAYDRNTKEICTVLLPGMLVGDEVTIPDKMPSREGQP